MAHVLIPTNSLFAFLAKSLAADTPTGVYKYMALGTGTGQTATNSTLKVETTVSGLARAEGTDTTLKTTVSNDTAQLTKAFTSAGATTNVTEVGSFENATKDKGTMGLYGTFSSAIPIESGDKITPTLQVQFKLD